MATLGGRIPMAGVCQVLQGHAMQSPNNNSNSLQSGSQNVEASQILWGYKAVSLKWLNPKPCSPKP